MNRNQRFLVALANTEHDVPLLEYVRRLALLGIGREFRFVHVQTPDHIAAHKVSPGDVAQKIDELVQEHFGQAMPEGSLYSSHVLVGERVDTLLEAITRSRADVAMLGHRKLRSGQRSLARRLAMIAPCSVWMVPEGAPSTFRRIVAPVDFSEHSADSLQTAIGLARMVRSEECLALHVFFDPSSIRYEEHLREQREFNEQAFDKFMAMIDVSDAPLELRTEEGPDPTRTILRVAKNQESDLIVMSTRGRSRAAAILLGSVTTQVMIESPVAVLAVKHYGAAMGLFQAIKDSHFWARPNPKAN